MGWLLHLRCFIGQFNRYLSVPGAKVYIDDILIWGSTIEEHDQRLKMALDVARTSGLKLNAGKCQYRQIEITLLGES